MKRFVISMGLVAALFFGCSPDDKEIIYDDALTGDVAGDSTETPDSDVADVDSERDESDVEPSEDSTDAKDDATEDPGSGDDNPSDDGSDEDIEPPECPSPDELIEPAISGTVYRDNDFTSYSFYRQRLTDGDELLGDVDVVLFSESDEKTTTTCPNGVFSFGGLDDGNYILVVDPGDGSECASTNNTRHLAGAIRNGSLGILTIGDSIPSLGDGDYPFFPARLKELMDPLVPTEDINVAVPGSVSEQWLPGSNFYENKVKPNLEQAQVVLMSLGGNDYVNRFGAINHNDQDAVAKAIEGLPEFQAQVIANLVTTIKAIQTDAPNVDIVYVLYPNFARSVIWEQQAGDFVALIIMYFEQALDEMVQIMGQEIEHLIIADMQRATKDLDIDPYLCDGLHLSELGTFLWAKEIFQALGGVIVGDEPVGMTRMVGFAPIDE